jgi:hypothetical protein
MTSARSIWFAKPEQIVAFWTGGALGYFMHALLTTGCERRDPGARP